MKRLEPKGQWKYRWEVPSSSTPDTLYIVAMSEHGDWACGCIGWTRHYPRKDCRHITLVKKVEPVDTSRQIAPPKAPLPTGPKFAALSKRELNAIEKSLKSAGGRERSPSPSVSKPEPFFVRQTRRAVALEEE